MSALKLLLTEPSRKFLSLREILIERNLWEGSVRTSFRADRTLRSLLSVESELDIRNREVEGDSHRKELTGRFSEEQLQG